MSNRSPTNITFIQNGVVVPVEAVGYNVRVPEVRVPIPPNKINGPASVTGASTSSLATSTVVREQYCLCSPKTKLEKALVLTVVIMSVVIITLVVLMLELKLNCEAENGTLTPHRGAKI